MIQHKVTTLFLNYYNIVYFIYTERDYGVLPSLAPCVVATVFDLHTTSVSNTQSLAGRARVSPPTVARATGFPIESLVVIITVRHGESSAPAARVNAKPDFQDQNGDGHAHAETEYLKHGVYLPYGHADKLTGPVCGIAHRLRRYPPPNDSVLDPDLLLLYQPGTDNRSRLLRSSFRFRTDQKATEK